MNQYLHTCWYFCDVNCQSMLLHINAPIGHSSNLKRSQFMYLHILILTCISRRPTLDDPCLIDFCRFPRDTTAVVTAMTRDITHPPPQTCACLCRLALQPFSFFSPFFRHLKQKLKNHIDKTDSQDLSSLRY